MNFLSVLIILRFLLPVNLLSDHLVLLIDVDDIYVALLISRVQLLLLLVPTYRRIYAFVRVLHRDLLGSFCGLKPFQFLVKTDRENEVLRLHQQHLYNSVLVEVVLLVAEMEYSVFIFVPDV